jgi:hypothetical protein
VRKSERDKDHESERGEYGGGGRTGERLGVGEGEEEGVEGEVVEALGEEGERGVEAEDQQPEHPEVEVEHEGGGQEEEDDREQQRAQEQLVHVIRIRIDPLPQHIPLLACVRVVSGLRRVPHNTHDTHDTHTTHDTHEQYRGRVSTGRRGCAA